MVGLMAVFPSCDAEVVMSSGSSATRHGPALRAIDGERHHPLDVGDGVANVVVFTTTDCPIANGYAPTIQKLVADFEPRGVRFFLVHVDPDLTVADAKEHAADYGHRSTVLLDPKHALVRTTGATITPEAVVVTGAGEVRYQGRIDDWYGDLGRKRPRPRRHDLRDALDAVVADRPVATSRTEAIGCDMPPLPGE